MKIQDSLSVGQDLNPGPPQYKAGVLTNRSRCSVARVTEMKRILNSGPEGDLFRDLGINGRIIQSDPKVTQPINSLLENVSPLC
jgi:hypothetical protein